MSNLIKEVESLIKRANNNGDAVSALQYSQAALNAANTILVLINISKTAPKTTGGTP